MRRLTTGAAEIDAGRLIADLNLGSRARDARPYTIANFVASADGRATVDDRSGGLGDDGDREIFRALRGVADAVLVGAGTLRAENYGRLVKDPSRRRRRQALGLAPEPIACTVTRSGAVPATIPLLAEPEARLIIFSAVPVTIPGAVASIETVLLDPSRLTMATVLEILRTRHGVRLLLCEGGPTLFSALLAERVVDELFLTLAPALTAGAGPTITAQRALGRRLALRLEWALQQGDSLYLRYSMPAN
jgi:riboflavin biosynthesis pyrimidine reductase